MAGMIGIGEVLMVATVRKLFKDIVTAYLCDKSRIPRGGSGNIMVTTEGGR